jgi:hypothetical protein
MENPKTNHLPVKDSFLTTERILLVRTVCARLAC